MSYLLLDGNPKWGADELGTPSDRITWSLSLAGLQFSDAFTEEQFVAAAEAAFDRWAGVTNLTFEKVEGDADIDVLTATEQEQPSLAGSTVGLAFYSMTSGPVPDNDVSIFQSATIYMDLQPTWSPAGETRALSYYAVLLHEIGHTIGLDHPMDSSEIMNGTISANDLGDGDIAGIQVLYGLPRYTDERDILDLSDGSFGQLIVLAGGDDDLIATGFADEIFGGAGNDLVQGGDGADFIIDVLGTNALNGQDGNDVIIGGGRQSDASGGQGNDIIIGGSGDNELVGGTGDDTIVGDTLTGFFHGDDVIEGGAGDDFLQGGGGADVFVFNTGDDTNTIAKLAINVSDPAATRAIAADFEVGIDRIDLVGFGYADEQEALGFVTDTGEGAQFSDQGTTIIFFDVTKAELMEADIFTSFLLESDFVL